MLNSVRGVGASPPPPTEFLTLPLGIAIAIANFDWYIFGTVFKEKIAAPTDFAKKKTRKNEVWLKL